MRTVFDNRQCAHVWAQQTQERGKSSNGQFYFNGATIYSYRDTWPLATFTNGLVLLNDTGYSVTTSKHMSYVRQALSNDAVKHYVSKDALYSYVNAWNNDYSAFINQVKKDCESAYSNAIATAAKRKKKTLVASDTETAQRYILASIATLAALGFEEPKELKELKAKFETEHSEAIALYKEQQAKTAADAERQRQERDKRNAQEYETVKPLWLKNEPILGIQGVSSYALNYGPTLLRVSKSGENIETSRGAEFPVDHAIKAFKIVRLCKDRGETYSRDNVRAIGGNAARLGHFTIDAIDAQGNVTAGCHVVPWEAIEHCAVDLGIYP